MDNFLATQRLENQYIPALVCIQNIPYVKINLDSCQEPPMSSQTPSMMFWRTQEMDNFLATQRLENQYIPALVCIQNIPYVKINLDSCQEPPMSSQTPSMMFWRTQEIDNLPAMQNLKINTYPHQYVSRTFLMSKSTQTPVRNHHCPLRFLQ